MTPLGRRSANRSHANAEIDESLVAEDLFQRKGSLP